MARRGRQDVELDAANEDRVRRLLGAEALQAPVARHPLRLDDLAGRERRRADVADLALVDEIGQRAERLVDVGVRDGTMHLVEVDPVGAQAPQRVLDLGDDPAPRDAAAVGIVTHRAPELRGQHDVVAAALQGLADDLLRLAGGVDVGGVDEVDPGIQRAVDDADRVVVVGVAPCAEHHRAEAELRDLDAGASERAVFHGSGYGVVDDLRVGLHAQRLGVRAAAYALVERVDRRDLLGGQREVEDVEVLGDAVRA